MEETIKVIKKDHGADLKTLKNKEKATIIDVLKNEYSLPEILNVMEIAKSSYYYVKTPKIDKYLKLRVKIREVFEENCSRYGYRRIHPFY